jgi:hypothetical protein
MLAVVAARWRCDANKWLNVSPSVLKCWPRRVACWKPWLVSCESLLPALQRSVTKGPDDRWATRTRRQRRCRLFLRGGSRTAASIAPRCPKRAAMRVVELHGRAKGRHCGAASKSAEQFSPSVCVSVADDKDPPALLCHPFSIIAQPWRRQLRNMVHYGSRPYRSCRFTVMPSGKAPRFLETAVALALHDKTVMSRGHLNTIFGFGDTHPSTSLERGGLLFNSSRYPCSLLLQGYKAAGGHSHKTRFAARPTIINNISRANAALRFPPQIHISIIQPCLKFLTIVVPLSPLFHSIFTPKQCS